MDTARIKAIAVLGYNFGLHVARSLIPGKKPDQAELFRSYFRGDRIAPFTAAEHEALTAFERCIACGLCPSHCRVMELSEGRFLGPMHIAVTASRSQPDFIHDLDSLLLCAVCGQCEPICPEAVPVADMARAMRRMIWRVAPESLPPAYHQAAENLRVHGSIYGSSPDLDLPAGKGEVVLVLGPALCRDPEKSRRVFEVLQKLGYDVAVVREGTIGGVAADMGLCPDTAWVDALAGGPIKTVIAAEPSEWAALKNEPGLSSKRIMSALEAVIEKLPAKTNLADAVNGPVAVHDSSPLRNSSSGSLVRQMLVRAGVNIVEMEPAHEETPPLGWEGGLDLIDPELAGGLGKARIEDARRADARSIAALSAADAESLAKACDSTEVSVVYFFDAIHGALF